MLLTSNKSANGRKCGAECEWSINRASHVLPLLPLVEKSKMLGENLFWANRIFVENSSIDKENKCIFSFF